MPARTVIVQDPSTNPQTGLKNDLEKALRMHLLKVSRVTIEKRPQGRPRNDRFLEREIEVVRETGETDDDLVDSVATEVIEVLEREADGSPWLGQVHLVDDSAKKKSDRILASIQARLNEHAELATAESEAVAILQTCRVFMGDMLDKMVKVMGAAAARETAIAELVSNVAKSVVREQESYDKYAWKRDRAKEETERLKVKETGRTMRSASRWEGMADIATEYKDVVAAWSTYLLNRERTAKLKAPRADEIDAVFGVEECDDLRALAHSMIAEPDRKRRQEISKNFRAAVKRLSPEVEGAAKLRALQHLGESRAKECYAWLFWPLSSPEA